MYKKAVQMLNQRLFTTLLHFVLCVVVCCDSVCPFVFVVWEPLLAASQDSVTPSPTLSHPAVPSVPDAGGEPTWHGGDQAIKEVCVGHSAFSGATLISWHQRAASNLKFACQGPWLPP